MIKELIDFNLRHGTLQVRIAVLSLLCMLTKDNRKGTEEMNNLIMTRIAGALKGHLSNPDLVSSHTQHEQKSRILFKIYMCLVLLINMNFGFKQFLLIQGSSVRNEIMLLATSLEQEDSCWEQRVRCGRYWAAVVKVIQHH